MILSTHIISDVEATATEIAVINEGRLVAHTTAEQLLADAEGKVWAWVIGGAEFNAVKRDYLISSTIRKSDGVHVRVISEGAPDGDAQAISPSLEDAYLHSIERSRALVAE